MKDNKADKKDPFRNISQEIKNIPIVKEYLKKEIDREMKRYHEDLFIAVALDLIEFWDLDKPSQNTLIKKIITRILKLETHP